MTAKKVSESYVIMSQMMLPEDANPAGIVHGGVVMKHMDNAGGVVAIRHARKICVTASIDRLDFYHPANIGDLLILKASVNFARTTSMEIGVRIEAENLISGIIKHTASAYLTYVALDDNFKPTKIPQLIFDTMVEKRRNKEAELRYAARLKERTREKAARINKS